MLVKSEAKGFAFTVYGGLAWPLIYLEKKSIKQITSPEELDGYIRVSKPSIWLVLAAVGALCIGILLWCVFGKLETRLSVHGAAQNGIMTVTLTEEESIQNGMAVYQNEQKVGSVQSVEQSAQGATIAYLAVPSVPNGQQEVTILVESISPIYFLWN